MKINLTLAVFLIVFGIGFAQKNGVVTVNATISSAPSTPAFSLKFAMSQSVWDIGEIEVGKTPTSKLNVYFDFQSASDFSDYILVYMQSEGQWQGISSITVTSDNVTTLVPLDNQIYKLNQMYTASTVGKSYGHVIQLNTPSTQEGIINGKLNLLTTYQH